MSHSLHIVIRCDMKVDVDSQSRRCPAYLLAPPSTSVPDSREFAATHGWTVKPGQPLKHIGATDYCPGHPHGKPAKTS